MIINKSRYKPFDVDVELGCADCKIVAANRDGTYQVLVFDGYEYVLFVQARVTGIEGCALMHNYAPCDWEPIIKAVKEQEGKTNE